MFLWRRKEIIINKGVATYTANTQVRIEILSKLTKFQNAPAYLHAKNL